MIPPVYPYPKHFILLILMILAGLSRPFTAAAAPEASSFQIRFSDTLSFTGTSSTLSTNIIFNNPGSDTLHLFVAFAPDASWRMLTRNTTITVGPQSQKVLSVSIISTKNSTSDLWSSVAFSVSRAGVQDTGHYSFSIRKSRVAKFSTNIVSEEELVLEKGQTVVEVPVRVRNEGNISMSYSVNWMLSKLSNKRKVSFDLAPGRDTVVNYVLKLSPDDAKKLHRDNLQIKVIDDSSNVKFNNVKLSYYGRYATINKSNYNTIPLTVNTGFMKRMNNDVSAVYVSLYGNTKLNAYTTVDYFYRSKDYTQLNKYQNNIFRLGVNSTRWNAYVGQVRRFNDFFVFGNELNLGVKWRRTGSFSVWGMKAYEGSYYNTNQVGSTLTYGIGKVGFEHTVISSFDSAYTLNGGIFRNKFHLFNRQNLRLTVTGGLGIDIYRPDSIIQQITQDPGTTLGYSLYAAHKGISISSNMQENSENFPGVYRGSKHSDHMISFRLSKTVSLSPFYNSNTVSNNFSVDTLLNTNSITFNMERYGLRLNLATPKMTLRGGLGYYRNTQLPNLPVYHYSDINFSLKNKKNYRVTLNSQSGLAENQYTGNRDLWFTSNIISASNRFLRVSGTYYRYPRFNSLSPDNEDRFKVTETMSFVTSYRFNFRKFLVGNLDYEIARFTQNNIITHNLGGMISYKGLNNGLVVSALGSIPIKGTSDDNMNFLASRNFMQVSVAKTFNVPIIVRKKYFDLKVRLFIDRNNNNVKDDEDEWLDRSLVGINDRMFITGPDGCVRYNNIEPGVYKLDYTKSQLSNGTLPAHGFVQTINLNRNMTINVPFKKGRQITGKVKLELDGRSNVSASPDNIKVIFSDSSGVIGHALTNSEGEFSFTVPAGHYEVSLNPNAFNEKLSPVQLKYSVDLVKNETAEVVFEVKQKKREIRLLNN